MGRKLLCVTLSAFVLTISSVAVASPPRQDSYYEIWCRLGDEDPILAKVVDAASIQPEKDPGGKDTATDQYNDNNPQGWDCWAEGPFTS